MKDAIHSIIGKKDMHNTDALFFRILYALISGASKYEFYVHFSFSCIM